VRPERWKNEKISENNGRLSGRIDNLYLELECIALVFTPVQINITLICYLVVLKVGELNLSFDTNL